MKKNSLLHSLATAWIATSAAVAQIPEGWFLVSQTSNVQGLWIVSPRIDAPPTPITNVPTELNLTINVSSGASTVTLAENGDAYAGNQINRIGQDVVVYGMQISGINVATSQRYFIGNASIARGGVSAMQFLPDGRLLFVLNNSLLNSPLGNSRIGTIDPATGTIAPFPINLSGDLNALAVDAARDAIYIGVPASNNASNIFRSALAGGSVTAVASTVGGVTGLAVNNDGNLLISSVNITPGAGTIDVATGVFTPIAAAPRNPGAIGIERATGFPVLPVLGIGSSGGSVEVVDGSGALLSVSTFRFGRMSGVAVKDSPRNYGSGTPILNRYTWQIAPNPGGAPFIGNAGFSLTLESSPGVANASALLLSPNRASLPFLGITILVDLTNAFTIPVASQSSVTIPIAIANTPALAGTVLHAQSLHIEAGGSFATSAGLTIGVITP